MNKRVLMISLLIIACAALGHAQSGDDVKETPDDPAVAATKQLASRDPVARQHAAEELARLEAADQRKLVEGYRLQEKNQRVKLALDWALYRFGKNEALFGIVRALDSSQTVQAESYLSTLDTPEPLYLFLERANGNTQKKLLDVLAKNGDAATLERIKPYEGSFDPQVAEAAQRAAKEIEERVAGTPAEKSTRPRQVEQSEPPQ